MSDKIHKQSFSINNAPTRSVTIYPTRAAVVRVVENVHIKPGTNEITLHNLSSHVESQSIKVEGHHMDGVVTEMSIDLVPNRSQGGYDDDDDLTESDSESEDEEALKSEELRAATAKVEEEEDILKTHEAGLESLRLEIKYLKDVLENSARTPELQTKQEEQLEKFNKIWAANAYTQTRLNREIAAVRKQLVKSRARQKRLQDRFDRSRRSARRERTDRRLQRQDRREERRSAKLNPMPLCYRVKIIIESQTLPEKTTMIVASAIDRGRPAEVRDEEESRPEGPYLQVSYVTGAASWSPQYDVRLDTVTSSASITYRALFTNCTGEVWKDANITLSTSQNSFSGINDKPPNLKPWDVTLERIYDGRDALYSADEYFVIRRDLDSADPGVREMPQVVELPDRNTSITTAFSAVPVSRGPPGPQRSQILHKQTASLPSFRKSLPAAAQAQVAPSPSNADRNRESGAPYLGMNFRGRTELESAESYQSDEDQGYQATPDSSTPTLTATNKKLVLAAASSSYHGTTTTYLLPGTRTIPPSTLTRRHIISETNIPAITFHRTCIPKLRTAVFLSAHIPLPSHLALLKGDAGLTLDNSFLGSTTVPRTAGGATLELGLGIDEAIKVRYPDPEKMASVVARNLVMRERIVTMRRRVVIWNRREGEVEITVKDQVPVSVNGELRILVVKPKDGKVVEEKGKKRSQEGGGSRTESSDESSAGNGSKVTAKLLEKGGGVEWLVKFDGPAERTLDLQWEARMPSEMGIANV